MITNERQYKVSRSQAVKFRQALRDFNELSLIEQGLDPLLVKAQREALESQLEELRNQLKQYEALKSGRVMRLSARAVHELGYRLVEARIAQNLSQKELAKRLGMKEQQVQRYEQERYASASLTRLAKICAALDVTFQLELLIGPSSQLERKTVSDTNSIRVDVSKFPIKVIKARGWLDEKNLGVKESSRSTNSLITIFISRASEDTAPALLRRGARLGADFDDHALLAWKSRIIWKVRNEIRSSLPVSNFSDLSWLMTIKELTLNEDGPVLAVEYLRTRGIAVAFEAQLPRTYLDGAALLVDDSVPTIALTLRQNRLDNFWFVLLHELGHIVLHREKGLKRGFFDDDEVVAKDKFEKEANDFARSVLVPQELWLSSLIRFTQSPDQIVAFAKENRVSSAVIAGWIRRERNDYSIFKELVGYGKVRKLLKKAGMLKTANVKDI